MSVYRTIGPLVYVLALNVWLVDWGLISHQQLRSYGDRTSVYSPILQTGEARDRTCDLWFTRRVT